MARPIIASLLHYSFHHVVLAFEKSPYGHISLAPAHLHDLAYAAFGDADKRVLWLWRLLLVHEAVIGLLELVLLDFVVLVVLDHFYIFVLVYFYTWFYFLLENFSNQTYLYLFKADMNFIFS